jgi:hypothetical protein
LHSSQRKVGSWTRLEKLFLAFCVWLKNEEWGFLAIVVKRGVA